MARLRSPQPGSARGLPLAWKSPARRGPFKALKPQVIVVTEGEKTEPQYIKAFQRIHRAANVTVQPAGFDPLRVVKKAIEIKLGLHSNAGARVWAVFDKDEHARFDEAVRLANRNGISLATSNPCFELWAIFHYEDLAAPIDTHGCQRRLEKLCENYDAKRGKLFTDLNVIEANHTAAVRRGEQSLREREKEGTPGGNPSTSMHVLMESIRTQSVG